MNFSVYNADRATHLRIVVTALVASIAIVAFATSAQIHGDDLVAAQPLSDGQANALKEYASGKLHNNSLTKIAIR